MSLALSADEARLLFLRAQGLAGGVDRSGGVAALLRRMGAVQLDTISVLARSHELVAYARLGAVGRAAVEDAYWGRPARAFEGIAHAMCILPLEHWPLFAARRRRSARRIHARRPPERAAMRAVLAALRERGPLSASDLGGSRSSAPRPANTWWHWSAEKIALERLLAIGEVVCVERRAWRRVYDLAERVIPARLRDRELDDATCHTALVELACDRLGAATVSDLRAYFGGLTLRETRSAIERSSRLLPVTVAGWAEPAWTTRRALALAPAGAHRTTLLSPFDPIAWDRARLERVFGLSHRLEAYVPAAARVHGYFAMPVLSGGRIVGRVDPARSGTTLLARRASGHPKDAPRIAAALVEAARWVGCDDVRVGLTRPAALGPALREALRSRR